jgi:hypothetical protein
MQLKELISYVNDSIALRKPNEAKVSEYAERMIAGVQFPPIIIGRWPKDERYGEVGIVDGLHRLKAAHEAKLKDFPTQEKKFASIQEALAFMYTANMEHGLPVSEGSRNSRIKLLRSVDPTLDIVKLGNIFKLGKSSIDRILKGEQGEGKAGRKTGAKAVKQQANEPLKPKAFIAVLERILFTFGKKRAMADIIDHFVPETEKGPELDAAKYAVLKEVQEGLQALAKEVA